MAERPSITVNPIKYLSKLEIFDGNTNDLFTFTNLVDRITPIMNLFDATSQELFGDIIKSRLKGKAREVIEINCQANVWTSIKEVLYNNFGERKNCEDLFEEMRSTEFRKNSITFFNEIKTKLRNLNNKTVISLGTNLVATQTCLSNKRSALNIFKAKIPEPMKTILACRNPTSLEDAMDILYDSGYADLEINQFSSFNKMKKNELPKPSYDSNKYERKNNFNHHPQGSSNSFQNHNYYRNNYNNSRQGQSRNAPRFPQVNQNSRNNYNNINSNYPPHVRTYQQPANVNPFNLQNSPPNVFNGNNNNYPAPEPMDVNHQQIVSQNRHNEVSENFRLPASTPTYHL